MCQAALCLAFYGFLRRGEFTTPSWGTFNPAIHATPADVSLPTTNLQFHIKQSKTDQHTFGHTVSLGATGGKQCPVRIIWLYLTHYSTGPQQPLFIRCNGKPLTLQDFRHDLHVLIKHIASAPLPWVQWLNSKSIWPKRTKHAHYTPPQPLVSQAHSLQRVLLARLLGL